MKKIMVVCGMGLGSSLIIEMNIKAVVLELGLEKSLSVSHTNLNSYQSRNDYDFVVCGKDLDSQIPIEGKTKKIILNNLLDKKEVSTFLKNI